MYYIAKCKCGAVRAALVECPEITRKEMSKSISDWVKRGYDVERVSGDFQLGDCTCNKSIEGKADAVVNKSQLSIF